MMIRPWDRFRMLCRVEWVAVMERVSRSFRVEEDAEVGRRGVGYHFVLEPLYVWEVLVNSCVMIS